MFSFAADATTNQPASDTSEDLIECYESFDGTVKEYLVGKCSEADIPIEYMAAIAYNESRFTADVINKSNANGTWDWGMMQINDSCFRFAQDNCGISEMRELLDPYQNIDCAIKLFLYHRNFTNDNDLALLRYQVGEGAYAKLNKSGRTTKTYDTVISYVEQYRGYFNNNDFTGAACGCTCFKRVDDIARNDLFVMIGTHKSAPLMAVGFAEKAHRKGEKYFLGEIPKCT